tara:strand:- start:128 stop:304 length:177 start_codon:yes stop_codon:yes gene_type:complete
VGFVSKTKFSLKSKVRNVKIAEYDFASQSEMKKARFILAFQLFKNIKSENFIQAYSAS